MPYRRHVAFTCLWIAGILGTCNQSAHAQDLRPDGAGAGNSTMRLEVGQIVAVNDSTFEIEVFWPRSFFYTPKGSEDKKGEDSLPDEEIMVFQDPIDKVSPRTAGGIAIPWALLAAVVLLGIGVASVAGIYPARSAAGLPITDSLKHFE